MLCRILEYKRHMLAWKRRIIRKRIMNESKFWWSDVKRRLWGKKWQDSLRYNMRARMKGGGGGTTHKKRHGHRCDSALQEVQIKMGEGRENAQKCITSGKWEGWQGTESLWVTLEQWHQRGELGKRMEIQIREVSKTDYEEHIHKYRVFTMDFFPPFFFFLFFLPCIL